jgi:hypothetical protein
MKTGGVLVLSLSGRCGDVMSDAPDRVKPATPDDLADALAFALRFDGRRRKRDAGAFMAKFVAERLVERLEPSGFVVMKRPPSAGAAALGRGYEGQ